MNNKVLLIVVIAIAVGAGVWLFSTATPKTPPAEQPPKTAPAPSTTAAQPTAEPPGADTEEPAPEASVATPPAPDPTPAPEPIVPPPPDLAGSDDNVRAAVEDFGPRLSQWLIPDNQLRKWVALVDQAAGGKLPRKYPPLTYEVAAFEVVERDEQLYLDPDNYARAKPLIRAITAISPQLLARYYRAWEPLLVKAYGELGKPGQFRERLARALDKAIAVEPLPALPRLKRPSVYYKFADPTLENADDVAKFMWRIGPENSAALQHYLQRLKTELDL